MGTSKRHGHRMYPRDVVPFTQLSELGPERASDFPSPLTVLPTLRVDVCRGGEHLSAGQTLRPEMVNPQGQSAVGK